MTQRLSLVILGLFSFFLSFFLSFFDFLFFVFILRSFGWEEEEEEEEEEEGSSGEEHIIWPVFIFELIY